METVVPDGALSGVTDSRLMFCAYKGKTPVVTKKTADKPSARNAWAALEENGFVVGKVIPARVDYVEAQRKY